MRVNRFIRDLDLPSSRAVQEIRTLVVFSALVGFVRADILKMICTAT